jgi:hypothetical protein
MSGQGTALVVKEVSVLVAHDLVAGAGQGAETHLVAHRPRRHEQRRLRAEEVRGVLLQRINRGIVPEDVVADLCLGHRLAHRRRRPSNGIGP